MLMYKQIGNCRWDNAYKWTTDEFAEFLSTFPKGTPIHSDLYIHSTVQDKEEFFDSFYEDFNGDSFECSKNIVTYKSRNGQYQMPIPQDGKPILYIQEGTMPVDWRDIHDGKAKNLIKKAYDIVGLQKFLAMVFDVIAEGDNDD